MASGMLIPVGSSRCNFHVYEGYVGSKVILNIFIQLFWCYYLLPFTIERRGVPRENNLPMPSQAC